MSLEIRGCKPGELPFLTDCLDQEFVFKKQRLLSLGQRFPNTLSVDNIEQIRVAVSTGGIRGALAIRLFKWIASERSWLGAMVGMVWVDALSRHMGVGSCLLSSAAKYLRDKGVDFGVLWTGTPSFYERSGWFSSDRGLYGEAIKCPVFTAYDSVSCRSLDAVDPVWLEHLRSSLLPMRVLRAGIDYRSVPIPAEGILCFSAGNKNAGSGFALVGAQGDTGYFYEMVAPSALWEAIWAAVTNRFSRIFVNGCLDHPFSQWLSDKGFVTWTPQCKTMWLGVSDRLEGRCLRSWHIPYFDWI